MSEITDERIDNCADDLEAMADIIMVTGQSGRLQAKLTMLRAARYLRAATPSSQSLAEAVERWRRARIAACEVGLQHPDYMDRLNELSEAEDALSIAKEPG
jgi:hypothetical protein